jgi:hypothetical protein
MEMIVADENVTVNDIVSDMMSNKLNSTCLPLLLNNSNINITLLFG